MEAKPMTSSVAISLLRGLVAALALLCLASCANPNGRHAAPTESSSPVALSSAGTGSSANPATPEASPPATTASLPDGVYRTSYGAPGSSTLTIHAGTYNLACGTAGDCGGTPLKWRPYVDVGTVHGTGATVWFVPDPARKSRLTGCVRDSEDDTGCGPADPYRFTWQLSSGHLSFQGFFGLGDQAGQADGYLNFTSQAWNKIR